MVTSNWTKTRKISKETQVLRKKNDEDKERTNEMK